MQHFTAMIMTHFHTEKPLPMQMMGRTLASVCNFAGGRRSSSSLPRPRTATKLLKESSDLALYELVQK